MTKEEIKSIVKIGNATLDFNLYSKAFNSILSQSIYIPTINWETGERETNIDKLVNEDTTDCVNYFLNLDKELFIDKLKDDIFKHFNIHIEATSYGQVPEELTDKYGNTEGNRIFFKGENKDTVFENCKFKSVFYNINEDPELSYFSIFADIDWEMEHGLTLYFRKGLYEVLE